MAHFVPFRAVQMQYIYDGTVWAVQKFTNTIQHMTARYEFNIYGGKFWVIRRIINKIYMMAHSELFKILQIQDDGTFWVIQVYNTIIQYTWRHIMSHSEVYKYNIYIYIYILRHSEVNKYNIYDGTFWAI